MSDFVTVDKLRLSEKSELVISKFQDKQGNPKYYVNTQYQTKDGKTGYSKGLSLTLESCKKLSQALSNLT